MNAKEYFDEQAKVGSFHPSYNGIAKIPFSIRPAIYEVMQNYATLKLEEKNQEIEKLKGELKGANQLITKYRELYIHKC